MGVALTFWVLDQACLAPAVWRRGYGLKTSGDVPRVLKRRNETRYLLSRFEIHDDRPYLLTLVHP